MMSKIAIPGNVPAHRPCPQPHRSVSADAGPESDFDAVFAGNSRETVEVSGESRDGRDTGSKTDELSSDHPEHAADAMFAQQPWIWSSLPMTKLPGAPTPKPGSDKEATPTSGPKATVSQLRAAVLLAEPLIPAAGLIARTVPNSGTASNQNSDMTTVERGSADPASLDSSGTVVEVGQQLRLPASPKLGRFERDARSASPQASSPGAAHAGAFEPTVQTGPSNIHTLTSDDKTGRSKPASTLHFDSALPSPAHSAARQILDLIESNDHASRSAAPASVETRSLLAGGDVRMLRMKLHPDSLGDVDVTLRRRGKEMHIEIVVTQQAAADAIQADIGLLNDRVGKLLAAEDAHNIRISIQPPDNTSSIAGPFSSESRCDAAGTFGGGAATGSGEGPPPRKQDAPTPHKERDGDEESQPWSGAAGLVV